MNQPKKLIVHCSATPNYKEFHALDIDSWHKARGWNGIGYHWVITVDGILEAGRYETEQGAHAKGHNVDSLGVCLIGNDRFTEPQVEALISLYLRIQSKWGIMPFNVYGHNELDGHETRACPNVEMNFVRKMLEQAL